MRRTTPLRSTRIVSLLFRSLFVVSLVMGLGTWQAAAQNVTRFADQANTLPGIQQAVYRYYSGTGSQGYAVGFAFAFDSEENAAAALTMLDTEYESQFAEHAIEITDLGTETRAYTRESFPHDAWTEILTHEGTYVYVVSFLSGDPVLDSVALATAMIRYMIAADAGEGMGEYLPDGGSSGGLWDKLPSDDDEVLPGFYVAEDIQAYPYRSDPEEDSDFGSLAGVQRVVSRSYTGDFAALDTPETAPATTYQLTVMVATFDTPESADAALETIRGWYIDSLAAEPPIEVTPVAGIDLGDASIADFGAAEVDGLKFEAGSVLVRSGSTIHFAGAIGVGVGTGALERATAVVEQMLAAGIADDDEIFDETGISTGGLWSVFPVEGDASLGGLVPEHDELVYP